MPYFSWGHAKLPGQAQDHSVDFPGLAAPLWLRGPGDGFKAKARGLQRCGEVLALLRQGRITLYGIGSGLGGRVEVKLGISNGRKGGTATLLLSQRQANSLLDGVIMVARLVQASQEPRAPKGAHRHEVSC